MEERMVALLLHNPSKKKFKFHFKNLARNVIFIKLGKCDDTWKI